MSTYNKKTGQSRIIFDIDAAISRDDKEGHEEKLRKSEEHIIDLRPQIISTTSH
jgi:hypothetical protein